MNEAEAYRSWRSWDRAQREYQAALRRLGAAVDALTEKVAAHRAEDRERRICELAKQLGKDKAFQRVLKAYTGHTPHGWLVACGCDGRMKNLIRLHGWDVLKEVIYRVRWANRYFAHAKKTDKTGVKIGEVV